MNENRFEKNSGTSGVKSKTIRFQDSMDRRTNKAIIDEKVQMNELGATKQRQFNIKTCRT